MAQPISYSDLIAWIENLFSGAPENEKALVTNFVCRYREAIASMDNIVTLEKTV